MNAPAALFADVSGCPVGMVMIERDGAVRGANAAAIRLLGAAGADGAGLAFGRLAEAAGQAWLDNAAAGRAEPLELEVAGAGATTRVLRMTGQAPCGGAGGATLWLEDVTERVRTAAALDIAEERLDLAVAGTRSATWQTRYPARMVRWSDTFFRILGYPEGAYPTEDDEVWARHIHPADVDGVKRALVDYLRGKADGKGGIYEATYRLCRLDGTVIWVVAKGQRTLGANGRAVRFNGIMLDVTAQKYAEQALRRAQADLIQAEKMASLGSLVAGVAHEINTPLGNTLTASSHLLDKVGAFRALLEANQLRRTELVAFLDLLGETARLMLANSERAAELVQSFKQVAVDQSSASRRRYNLGAYIDEVLVSLRPSLRPRLGASALQVRVSCPPDLEMDGYPGAMSQVLTNFVMNSLMHGFGPEESGTLSIEVTTLLGGWVQLVYADDGRGIPAENIGRIFDPFFTTRRGSGGSGLGLHIVFNIVTSTLRGTIACASTPGGGTRFTITMPRVVPE